MTAFYRNFETRAEIDAEYDVEKSVPDFTVHARQYGEASAFARRRLECAAGIRYGPTVEEYLDVFPAARRNAPVLIFLHGGYWRILSAREFSFVALGPRAAGVTTAVVNYALCPRVTLDEIVRQVRASVSWVYRNIRSYNGNPDRIFLSGHSAGGNMTATALLLTDWRRDYELPADTVKGGISISGLFDLTPLRLSFLQPDLRLDAAAVDRHSPQFHVRPVSAPLLITYGEAETSEFRRQSEDFLRAWTACGNRSRSLIQSGGNHFTAISGFDDPASPLCEAVFGLMEHTPRRVGGSPRKW